jgi:hypothetical protein
MWRSFFSGLSGLLRELLGVVVGAAITVIAFVFLGRLIPPSKADMLTFAIMLVAFVAAAMAIVGAVTIVNSWNDIDKRVKTSTEKYEAEALKAIEHDSAERKQEVERDAAERKQELERNATERQAAIEESGARVTAEINHLTDRVMRRTKFFTVAMGVLLVAFTVLYVLQGHGAELMRAWQWLGGTRRRAGRKPPRLPFAR